MLRPLDEKGMAAIVAFSVLFILLTLGAIFLFSMDTEFKIATNQKASTQALYIAEAGLERGIMQYFDSADPSWWGTSENLGAGSYTVTKEEQNGSVVITSTGEVESLTQKGVKAKRIVRVKIVPQEYKYALLSGNHINSDTCGGTVTGDVHANGSVYIDKPPLPDVTIDGEITEGDQGDPQVSTPLINMSYYESKADEVIEGDYTFTRTNNNKLFYLKATYNNEGDLIEPGKATIDATSKKATFQNSSIVAEGGIEIIGGKEVTIRRKQVKKEDYPALATKTGQIIESGSGVVGDRDIKGLVYSEQGLVEFEYILLEGNIIAGEINLKTEVDITYTAKWVDNFASSVGGVVQDWQEIY